MGSGDRISPRSGYTPSNGLIGWDDICGIPHNIFAGGGDPAEESDTGVLPD